MNNVEIVTFVTPANVVRLANSTFAQYRPDRSAMVCDIEPVTHILPVTVHRQALARHGVANHEWNQLFREVVRPIVIGAVCRQCW